MNKLNCPVDERVANQEDNLTQPLTIARIICTAKVKHPDDRNLATYRERLVKAVVATPEVFAQTFTLTRIAKKFSKMRNPKKRKSDGTIAGNGWLPSCYDLSSAKLILCEDI